MTDFTMKTDADGVAIITWDVAEKSMNVLSLDGWGELDACVDKALADDAVKGIIITSGKDTFAGGMDLNVIAKMKEVRWAANPDDDGVHAFAKKSHNELLNDAREVNRF